MKTTNQKKVLKIAIFDTKMERVNAVLKNKFLYLLVVVLLINKNNNYSMETW